MYIIHMDNIPDPPQPNTESEIVIPESLTVPYKHCTLMYNMIHVIAKRGGITADEFTVVGELVDFLKTELRVDELFAAQKAKKQATTVH